MKAQLDILRTIDLLYDLDESQKQNVILLNAINDILMTSIKYPGWHELQIIEICKNALNKIY